MKRAAVGLFLSVLLIAAPARAGWLTRCLARLGATLSGTTPSDIELTAEETRALKAWNEKYALPGTLHHGAFTDDQMQLALAELPATLRSKLFAMGKTAAVVDLPRQVRARLTAAGFSPEANPALAFAVGRIRRDAAPGEDPHRGLEEAIAASERLPSEARTKLESDRKLRREVYLAQHALGNLENPQYRLRFQNGTVILPDGKRYPYTRNAFGQLKIAIRYGDLIQHQSYENDAIVAGYRGNSWNGFAGLDGGFLAPDGRYVMVDAYHRAKAYALAHTPKGGKLEDTPVPVLVSPNEKGQFYTATHWSVMTTGLLFPRRDGFSRWNDKAWGFLTPEQRRKILDTAPTDPAGAIRDWYYESTGLSRLQ